jgi:VWFA-related protein
MSKEAGKMSYLILIIVLILRRFKFITILVLSLLFATSLFAQKNDEEKRRIDFVKNLEKQRNRPNSNSDLKRKPALVNDPGPTTATEQANDEETIKVETRLVRLDVLVYDEKRNIVLGLKADDFIISENKIPQEIGTFSLGSSEEIPRTIVLILDYSGSQFPYIRTSVDSAKILVDKLNSKDRMAIVTDDVELLVDFTQDKELLKSSLDKLRRKAEKGDVGKSFQFSALYVTIKEMFDNEEIRPIIIFQTDGDQLFNVRPASGALDRIISPLETGFTDRQLIDSVERSRATIYSVISGYSLLELSAEERLKKTETFIENDLGKGVKDDPEAIPKHSNTIFRQQNSMVNVAKMSGGFAENLEKPEEAALIYENILKGITNRYLIGYYPLNQDNDGTRRQVRIEVKNHPEYVILGRKFYFAPAVKKLPAKN